MDRSDAPDDERPGAPRAPEPSAPAPARPLVRGGLAALADSLWLALPCAALIGALEWLDTVVSNPGYVISAGSRLFYLLSVVAFYLLAALALVVPQALLVAGLRRWALGPTAWTAPGLLAALGRRFARAPRGWATLLAGSAAFLGATFYLGYRLFRFTVDAQFELPGEAAAVMSALHLAGAVGITLAAGALGYALGRLALRVLPVDTAFRALAALPLLVVAALGYGLFTRVLSRILDLRWLGWLSFLLVLGCLQAALALLAHRAADRADGPPGRLRRALGHRYARLGAAGLAALVIALGLHGYADLQLVRFQIHRFGRFVPHVSQGMLSLLDRDGDGHLALLGGLDCDDGDPRRHPGAHDIPSDGVDANCFAGDPQRKHILAAWMAQRTAGRVQPGAGLPVPRAKHNVLLITIDALRADHMSLYGYRRKTTPNLRSLGNSALVFSQCHSQSNFTDLALYSLVTGLYPSAFVKGESIVAGRTLADYLKGFGYQTHAINDLREGRGFFARGFDTFDNTLALRNKGAVQNQTAVSTGADLTALAKAFLDRKHDRPFLLWVHYSEPHGRYLKHRGLDFGDRDVDRYDSEIAFADRQVAALLGHAKRLGLLRRSIVVIGSDHGEAFGEHGRRTHGHTLYEEETHVPLLIFVPTGKGGGHAGRVEAPVENVDVVPTVLDLVGYGGPVSPMHGESLVGPAFAKSPLRSPGVWAEQRHKGTDVKALTLGTWKIVYDVKHAFFELYDLARDPRERRNLADDRPRQLAAMRRFLFQWIDLWCNGFKTWPVGKP